MANRAQHKCCAMVSLLALYSTEMSPTLISSIPDQVIAGWRDLTDLAAALKPVCQAANAKSTAMPSPWTSLRPGQGQQARDRGDDVVAPKPANDSVFVFLPETRRIIYTTHAIESLLKRLLKLVKNRGHFPSNEAAARLRFLVLRANEKYWKMLQYTWRLATNQSVTTCGECFTNAII